MVICVLYSVGSKLRQKGERDKHYSGLQHCIFMRYGNLLADHDFLWNSQWKVEIEPQHNRLFVLCKGTNRHELSTFCIYKSANHPAGGWKVINCRNDTHVILSAVDIVPELKKSIGKTRHGAPQSQKPVPALQKKLEVSRFAISFDRQPFPQTHPLQHWTTKTKMKEESL